MSNFNDAYKITMKHEGGYSNDRDDAGGETYKGIARRFNPSWDGWDIIDLTKQKYPDTFTTVLSNIQKFNESVKSFYKINYWDKFQGDSIPNQDLANELFDNAVNMGVRRSVRFLQEGLNLLNRNQKNYDDIVEDGLFGNGTLKTLNYYLSTDKPSYLIKLINILQGMHYINYMKKSPTQEKYARGWLRRVTL